MKSEDSSKGSTDIIDTNEEDTNEEDIIEEDKIPDITELSLTKKEMFNYKIINKYYKTLDKKQIETMIDIINGKSKISLRLLDWFITKYADRYKVRYNRNDINDKNNDAFDSKIESNFNIHISYKAQLKSYRKKYFDPFRREKDPDKVKKFRYYFDKEKTLTLCTTIGQLNFFKWAFSNGVINYVNENYSTIIKAMRQSNKSEKNKKTKEKEKEEENDKESTDKKSQEEEVVIIKKHGININAKKNIKNDEIKIVLSFD
jgi:hypothetical protein